MDSLNCSHPILYHPEEEVKAEAARIRKRVRNRVGSVRPFITGNLSFSKMNSSTCKCA